MQCPACSTDNPEHARFCMNCGARLTHMCPECDTRLPVEARFCFACGARVGAAPPALVQQPLAPGGVAERLQRLVPKAFAERLRASGAELAGERRVVTILF
ncbi:MAG: zinc ribbon domain-containing protein, partial [Anaerolineae bacterium]|nr:zinc ribbon domain-containing protein [Anaerolineae bacterium]